MRTMRHEERHAKSAQMGQERAQAKPPHPPAALSGTGWLPVEGFKGPIVTTHAVLMHTGKVLFIAGSTTDLRIFELVPPVEDPDKANSCPADPNDVTKFPPPWSLSDSVAVWDPVSNTFSRPAVPLDNSGKPLDLFCVGHSVLPDGRVLAAGGTSGYAPDRGLSTTVVFDPKTEKFTTIASMNSGRWYPTFVTLGSGRVFCVSGINNQGNDVDFNPEIFSSVGWTSFSWPTRKFPTYPQMFLLQNGSIFYSGGSFNENAPIKPCILTTDNNGYAVIFPAVGPNGALSLVGALILGIGSQANNAPAGVSIYVRDPTTGTIRTTYKGTTSPGFLDTGSTFFSFRDATIPVCPSISGAFCPSSPLSLSAVNQGVNQVSGTVNFQVVNARSLQNTDNAAFENLAGPDLGLSGEFDWGLPFFLGRTVYTGIAGRTSTLGVGPYWAY